MTNSQKSMALATRVSGTWPAETMLILEQNTLLWCAWSMLATRLHHCEAPPRARLQLPSGVRHTKRLQILAHKQCCGSDIERVQIDANSLDVNGR